ncbi:MAG: bacteriohemerythrin [Clostridiales bacterium]|nr:bacteriohemerythrin [Clostridiales bacterium]
MWKESYKVGLDFIDTQHKKLFEATQKLLDITQSADAAARKLECDKAILFLKEYAARHFAEEEEYMLSINYEELEKQKVLHRIFVSTIHTLEQKLRDLDFGIPAVKEFTGFLTTWLIYHVAGVDQRIGGKKRAAEDTSTVASSYINCFAQSVRNVLETMAGLTAGSVSFAPHRANDDDIRILVGLVGDHEGHSVFTFSRKFTFGLIKALTSIELTDIDELACSALCEMANIISGNASALISSSGANSDITTPQILSGPAKEESTGGFYLDTEFGRLAVSVDIA